MLRWVYWDEGAEVWGRAGISKKDEWPLLTCIVWSSFRYLAGPRAGWEGIGCMTRGGGPGPPLPSII